MLKGHGIAFLTEEKFVLEDDLFSLQRTFALLEAQTESVVSIFLPTIFLDVLSYRKQFFSAVFCF